jgi:hypothetical protein
VGAAHNREVWIRLEQGREIRQDFAPRPRDRIVAVTALHLQLSCVGCLNVQKAMRDDVGKAEPVTKVGAAHSELHDRASKW